VKILVHLLFSALVFSLVACGGNAEQVTEEGSTTEEQAEEQLYEEVMTLHDEVMPRMGELMNLKGQLEEAEVSGEMESEVNQTAQSLENAHESMMQWMSELKQLEGLGEEMTHEEVMTYLTEQKETMQAVQDSTMASIERANQLLSDLEQE